MTRAIVVLLAGLLCAGVTAAEVRDVSPQEAAAWQRWAIPLPKRIEIPRKLDAVPAQIGIRLRRGATEPEQVAAAQLEELLDSEDRLPAADQVLRIVIGVCDDEGMVRGRKAIDPQRLRGLPNSDQAYAIVPLGDSELALTALTPAGVYYAAQTLRQLLEATLTDGRVEVPLVEVLDWPDLSERGEWGGSSVRDIEMLAAHKMNLVETHVGLHVREDGTTEVTMSAEDRARARANALNLVPIITHLEHLKRTGLYDVYPELAGEGYDIETAPRGLIAPCASNPRFVDILAGWMDGMASLEGVTDICAWLSESHVQCECEECQKVGQFVLETRALVKAYRQIQNDHPDVGLRILLTQGSYETNDKVLEEVPPDIGVTYYHGGRTYDSSREEMIYPLLEDYADEGRWLGCYPQLTASWRIVCPWTGPQFIHYRMNEFVSDGLECLCGYATPDNVCYEFNVIAAAEWSWNAKGRSPREFAAAYFTRRGFEAPDAAAEWAVRMGPVGWDLYGSRVPYSAFFGRAAAVVKGRTVPTLGEGMYRYFPSLERLDADIETCRWAAETAREWEAPTLVAEAETVGGMVRMLRTIYDMTVALSQETPQPAQTRQRLNELMYEMALASQQATSGLRDWRESLEGWEGARRFDDTIEVIDQTASEIGEFMQQFGIEDPGRPYRMTVVGGWTAEDFEENRRREKTFDVTDMMMGPGTYTVGFRYTSGWNGLHSYAVELLEAEGEDPEGATVVASDEHEGSAGARPENTAYTLEVEETDPEARYFIRVDIRGTPDTGLPADRQGCNGDIWMRKAGQLDAGQPPPPLRPMTEDQAAAFGPPRFVTEGVHAAVLPGGYGASAIQQWLGEQEGVEVRPLSGLGAAYLKPCDVVILPQPKMAGVIGDDDVRALRDYVRGGGGLIATHDSVGFRDQPAVIPEVCAGGVDKIDVRHWMVVAEHPVTAGIEPDVEHPHSYYDHIQLEPGSAGVVLAKGAGDELPVVVAGSFGEGRYVAIGLAVGIDDDASDVPPQGAEAQLLLNAVTWAGAQ